MVYIILYLCYGRSELSEYAYVNLKVSRDTDITQFWKENKSILPKLFSVVKQVLCIPASSAASERVFSRAYCWTGSRKAPHVIVAYKC